MADIPREPGLDHTLAFLAEGYRFIPERVRRFGSDIFQTRLMLRPVTCLHGAEAAAAFYTPGRFTRQGAMPPTTLRLLQGRGSVQSLDGLAHRWRKKMFMEIVRPDAVATLVDLVTEEWTAALARWSRQDRIRLLSESEDVLTRAACRWAGCPLTEDEAPRRAREFSAMITGSGSTGARVMEGVRLRRRTERWAQDLIERTRDGRLSPPEGSALALIARHRGEDDHWLDLRDAVYELINILRPTVAIGRFITFAALALHEHPEARPFAEGSDPDLECFVQEVRRLYPFFPVIGGRVREPFAWGGHEFAAGDWVLLDLYGTNHDPRRWPHPEAFRPERFRDWEESAYDFVPQGGGDVHQTHRCPGERPTIEVMKRAVRLLATGMRYDVPADQDLSVDLSRMPAEPASGFLMRAVRSAP